MHCNFDLNSLQGLSAFSIMGPVKALNATKVNNIIISSHVARRSTINNVAELIYKTTEHL